MWELKPLAEVADFCLGKMLDQAKNKGELRPYLANINVRWGEFDLENLREMRFERDEFERYGLRGGDILMCEGGEPGRCAIWKEQVKGMMIQKALHRIRAKECIDSSFLFYSLLKMGRGDEFSGLFTGATIKHLPREKLALVRVPTPSLPIQRRIASILSAYDDLIQNNSHRIGLLEEMARRVHEEWFVRFRYPGHRSGDGPENLPPGWRRVPIVEAYDGLFDGPHATPSPADAGPVFLGIGNIREEGGLDLSSVRHIAEEDFAKWTKRVTPREGDIVFTYEATLNRYALIPKGFRGCLGRRLALIRTTPESRRNLFLYLHFFSADWREVITQNTLSGATVDRIPLSKLPQFPITLPPDDLIHRFDDIVRPMFEQVDVLRRKNTNLRAQRDLLLPKLMSGEIDVSEAAERLEAAQ
jgi:type I restriction enzyme S subunit